MRPTRRLALLAAAAAALALVVPPLVVLVIVALVGLGALADVAWAGRAVDVTREPPERVTVGTPVTIPLHADGDVRVMVRQPGCAGLEVSGGADPEMRATVAGRHLLPPAVVERTGPLGLVAIEQAVGSPVLIAAFPRSVARRSRVAPRSITPFDEEGGQVRGPLGLGTSFESLRDYQQGDDVRLVNWHATARAGRPVVNQFRIEQSREVVILLDQGRAMAGMVDGQPRLRWAVEAASAVALAAGAIGDRPGLVVYDDAVRAQVRPTTRSAAEVVRALLGVEGSLADSDLRLVLGQLPRKRAIVVVIANPESELTIEPLVASVPVLARRHAVIVVAASDPSLARITSGSAHDSTEARLTTAAARLLGGTERSLSELRSAGAAVVAAAPAELAHRLVLAYWRAKGQARA